MSRGAEGYAGGRVCDDQSARERKDIDEHAPAIDVPQRTIVVSQATASANKGKELPLSYLSPRLTIADQSKTVAKPWYHLTNVANADCN